MNLKDLFVDHSYYLELSFETYFNSRTDIAKKLLTILRAITKETSFNFNLESETCTSQGVIKRTWIYKHVKKSGIEFILIFSTIVVESFHFNYL